MTEIIIKTQSEMDALPASFSTFTRIIIQNDPTQGRIIVRMALDNSSVEALGNSSVKALGNSSVVARGNSSVEAYGNSSVVARDNSSVVARENSSVQAWENSSVVAYGNSSVEARENSSVQAWENSSVQARDNSSVVARDNSSVQARDNSSVEAYGNAGVYLQSTSSTITLFGFAVCWALAKGKVIKKSTKATVIKPTKKPGANGWLEDQGVKKEANHVVLFKRVSSDYKTQENTANETVWTIGQTLTHPNYSPKDEECGAGKFHACSRPYFCDEFRSKDGDKYIAIKIAVKDLYAWPSKCVSYPYKIAFRKGKVMYECNKVGKQIV